MLIASGCATNRSTLNIGTPSLQSNSACNAATVVSVSAFDNRSFQDNPSDPAIPSIGFGGLATADKSMLSRAIGRKRNGFGKALGDVFLGEGQSVQGLVTESVVKALEGMDACRKLATKVGSPADLRISVKEFWSYLDVTFTHLILTTRIVARISMGEREEEIVSIESTRYMVVTEKKWTDCMKRALLKFETKASPVLERLISQ
jgi:hypothetical protein